MLRPPKRDELSPCPYLPGRQRQFEYFYADRLEAEELSQLLCRGWRKFGPYFFRPVCPDCRHCIPLRVPVQDFVPSRSQRRVLKKGAGLQVSYGPLHFEERIFDIYSRHALMRFGQPSDRDDFIAGFYLPSCPALQMEIHHEGTLVGVGFLDRGNDALSSVYFCFDPDYGRLNLGTYSVLVEIERAREMGLRYHYLGYYVPGCGNMVYKDHFRPRQHYDWQTGSWRLATTEPGAEI